ncbi:BEM46 family protein-like protein [Myxozyma melibiosi]|uniref:BEM46 family protein-like protein n=1 Tax=Myxozyma melibiosi TaxID=54550 RepID=A0ABR1FDR7_9ASCO
MDPSSIDWSVRMLVRTIKILSATGVSCVGALAVILYFAQSALIYPSNIPPGSRTEVQTPKSYDLPYEDVTLETEDGEKIKLFVMKQTDPELRLNGRTVIICCANAGNMGHRLPIASAFYKILQYNVILFSYRGYGLSTGKPNEVGLKIDAETVFKHVKADPELKDTGIVLYGQSLGGAVAIYLADKHQDEVAGLIVENTFRSIPSLIPSVLPVARYFTFLCHQTWPSEELISKISNIPVLLLSGLNDEIVPPSHMKYLYEHCSSPSKVWRQFANATHNETYMKDGYWTSIIDFSNDFMDKKTL